MAVCVLFGGYAGGQAQTGAPNAGQPSPTPALSGDVETVEELESVYCGPDSLWFGLMRLGINRSLPEIRRLCITEVNGDKRCSLWDLKETAVQFGVHAYVVRLNRYSMEELARYCENHDNVQVILHFPMKWGHFMPIARFEEHLCQVFDMASFMSGVAYISAMPPTQKLDAVIMSKSAIPKSVLSRVSCSRVAIGYRLVLLCVVVSLGSFALGVLNGRGRTRKAT